MDSKSLLIGAALAGGAVWGWPRARDWWRRKRTPPPDIQLRDAGLSLLDAGLKAQRDAQGGPIPVPVGGIPYEDPMSQTYWAQRLQAMLNKEI